MRWLSLGAGVALITIAFAAATRVADTREGLISEVVTLLAGLGGISLVLYGLFAYARPATTRREAARPVRSTPSRSVPNANGLLIGVGGIVLAVALLAGLAISGGPLWAMLGLVLLLPMVSGSVYLCARFIRSPAREWTIDLRRLIRSKEPGPPIES